MNKFLVLILLSLPSFNGLAQHYKPIRVAFGIGLSHGVIAYFEPSVRITDKFSLGYRSEGGAFLGGIDAYYVLSSKGGVLQYYFLDRDVRFFAGLGCASYTYHETNYTSSTDPSFGFFPRIGYDAGHLTACVDFNVIDNFTTSVYPPHSFPTTETHNHNYISIRIGLVIGGGPKKEPQYTPVIPVR